MLGRRSDVYSSLARFVSSIACKRQTSPHRNVEKDETGKEEKRRERWYLLHKYISRSMAEEEGRRGYGMKGIDMLGKRITVVELFTFKSFGHRCYDLLFISSRIHTCTSSDTHSHNIHSMQRPPRRTTVQITPIPFEPRPTISPLDRYSR